jgi:TonB family protein
MLASVLLAAFTFAADAQGPAAAWGEWETISPQNEEFTVLMPKNSTTESTKFPYHNMELSARLYLASSSAGPVLALTSLSGIRSDPSQYTEFARFNAYIDAFKTFFPAKVRSKDALTKLTLVTSRPFHGYTGRSYKLTIGDLSGSVHAFVTKKRFYAVVSLNTKRDDALEEKFLSSFVLPDRPMDAPMTTAASADQGSAGEGQPATNSPTKNPVAGGMLNGKAIYLPLPELPPGEANGVVLVAIIVDEQGTVIEARAISGPQHLQAAAVNAARLARFTPTLRMGEPVKVSGTLSYNFVRPN